MTPTYSGSSGPPSSGGGLRVSYRSRRKGAPRDGNEDTNDLLVEEDKGSDDGEHA